MHVFRWMIGSLAAVLVIGSILSFVLFIVVDIEVWIARARSLRRAAFATVLFWFNIEVWGSVIYTIVHW